MPGMTAYFGLLDVGQPKPGETVVVSAASGAVGQVVGQIAKIAGCRVVGIAGGAKKCAFVKDELGFDACIDYRAEKDLDAALQGRLPRRHRRLFRQCRRRRSPTPCCATSTSSRRVALCGSISQYNATTPPMGPRLLGTFVGKRVRRAASSSPISPSATAPARRQMGEWVRSGRIKYREDVVEGIDKAPRAFIGMLRGENFGKMLVKLG